jgi:hypothetical protein
MPEHIIVTGSDGGFGNLGDELLLAGVQRHYASLADAYTITVLMMRPRFLGEGFVTSVDERSAFEALNVNVEDIALLHYYGGGYLNTYWYESKIWLLRYLLERGLPLERVVFTGQGLLPLPHIRHSRHGLRGSGFGRHSHVRRQHQLVEPASCWLPTPERVRRDRTEDDCVRRSDGC